MLCLRVCCAALACLLCCARVFAVLRLRVGWCASVSVVLPILNPIQQVGVAGPSCPATRPELPLGLPVAPSRLPPDARRPVSTAWFLPRPHRCASKKFASRPCFGRHVAPKSSGARRHSRCCGRQVGDAHTESHVSNSASRTCPWLPPFTPVQRPPCQLALHRTEPTIQRVRLSATGPQVGLRHASPPALLAKQMTSGALRPRTFPRTSPGAP